MERNAMQYLKKWKEKPNRKPLIIRGARQVGKTWLMKAFGEAEYANIAYINFESSQLLKNLFTENFDLQRILTAIQIETGVQINADNTLIILDEIQEAEGAITSLKYFYENLPQYHIVAAGSLLGVAIHQNFSFPVGKVDFLDLTPLSFYEFLSAVDARPLLDLLKSKDWTLITGFKEKLIHRLREYYYIGGMPEAVQHFSIYNDFDEVRAIQKRILMAYEQDFSKHAPSEIVPRIRMLWNAVPAQLAKENKKFIYGAVKPGARAKEFELALSWLIDCGLVHKVCRTAKPAIPLKAYEDISAFKLFTLDVGLLAAMGDIDVRTLINGNKIFEEFKGALTEQYVLQQLNTFSNMAIYYWTADKSSAEIDFLIQLDGKVIPLEVKAAENLQSKSLKAFCQRYKMSNAIRSSMADYRKEEWMTNLPLYAIGEIGII